METDFQPEFLLRVGAVLAGVVAVMYACGWLFRSWTNRAYSHKDKHLHVLETLMLDPRRKLVLIGDGSAKYLLMLGPSHDLFLGKIHDEGKNETYAQVREPSIL